jgi:hypothetical protein
MCVRREVGMYDSDLINAMIQKSHVFPMHYGSPQLKSFDYDCD